MIVLLQIAVILGIARATSAVLRLLKQPAVVAEMVSGFLLGPSFFGWLAPAWFASLFPASSLEPLNALSQIGLVVFMFLVGLRVRPHASVTPHAAAFVSGVSIIVPFAGGTILGAAMHARLAPPGVALLPFALFIGAAMSITAFPVLVRLLNEHGLFATNIGVLAIACAAFDDVAGWLILAGILSVIRGGAIALAWRIVMFAVYLGAMIVVVRPLLEAAAKRWRRPSGLPAETLALALLVALWSAVATEALGVHALFGAFFAGLMMPRDAALEAALTDGAEPLTKTLLLPLFFAFTGLRTSVGLIDSPGLLRDAALILAVATIAKGAASALAARVMGIGWRDASLLGILLNTRGLIELVILNIGYEAGILSPLMFSMMVVMALVTTFIASPLLRLVRPAASEAERPAAYTR